LAEGRAIAQRATGRRGKSLLTDSPDLHPTKTDEFRKIKLKDGRTVVLGPPSAPTDLVIPRMFKDRPADINQIQIMTDMNNAEVAQYVRQIDEVQRPSVVETWRECIELMHTLGDIGWKSVKSAYNVYFGMSETYWIEVKN
jgi:hypothetical protein